MRGLFEDLRLWITHPIGNWRYHRAVRRHHRAVRRARTVRQAAKAERFARLYGGQDARR